MKINQLQESSLSRIQRKIDNHSTGVITAYRGDKTYQENQTNNKKLLAFLLNAGYSVTKVRGSYIENRGSDTEKEVAENSFFVANQQVEGDDNGALENDLVRLGKLYDQDSILSIRNGADAKLIGTSSREDSWPGLGVSQTVGKPTFGDPEGEFFSRIGGRKFAFEEDYSIPETINGKRSLKIVAEEVANELAAL